MLIKEYRIPMPMTVDEYRIAQLYMIAVSLFDRSTCDEKRATIFLRSEKKTSER